MKIRKSIRRTRKYKGGWFYKSPKNSPNDKTNSNNRKLKSNTIRSKKSLSGVRGLGGKRKTNSRTQDRKKKVKGNKK